MLMQLTVVEQTSSTGFMLRTMGVNPEDIQKVIAKDAVNGRPRASVVIADQAEICEGSAEGIINAVNSYYEVMSDADPSGEPENPGGD